MAGAGKTEKVRYGKRLGIAGRVSPGAPGRSVRLEHAVRGAGFRPVAVARTRSDGSYRFAVTARTSGAYRAVSGGAATSAPRRVTVVAAVEGGSRRHVLGSRPIRVKGTLLPAVRGRRVTLQMRRGRGWATADRSSTGAGGRFSATFRPRRAGSYRLRVRFGGTASPRAPPATCVRSTCTGRVTRPGTDPACTATAPRAAGPSRPVV